MKTRILLLVWVVLGVAAEALYETVNLKDLNSDHERRYTDAAIPSYLEARIKRQQDLDDVKLSSQENVRVNGHEAPVIVPDVDETGAKKVVKKDTDRVKEFEAALFDALRQLDDTRAALTSSERKRIALATELEDALQESAECARKNAENETADISSRLTEVTPQVTALTNDKRRMEADVAVMQSDLDEDVSGKIAAEEHADRLQAEVHRLAEELRKEKENYKDAESLRKQLEVEIRKLKIRLEDAEAFSMRAGKRQLEKFQARIHDLEAEYEFEQRRAREAMANARKQERQYKELQAVIEDDKRQIAEITSLTDSLNSKIKTYRGQIDEAEEVANIAMNKYRQATVLIEEVEHRAYIVERTLQALRRSRSMSESREITKVVRI